MRKKLVAKKMICLVMVFLVMGLVGCSSDTSSTKAVKEEIKPSQQNVEATKDYQTYTDAKYGFLMKYPSSWKKDNDSKDVAVTFSSDELESINVVVADALGFKLNDLISETVKELQKSFTGFNIMENSSVMMGSMPAQKLVYTANVGGLDLKFMQYITIVDKKQYAITYCGTNEGYDKQLGTAQNIIDSFTN